MPAPFRRDGLLTFASNGYRRPLKVRLSKSSTIAACSVALPADRTPLTCPHTRAPAGTAVRPFSATTALATVAENMSPTCDDCVPSCWSSVTSIVAPTGSDRAFTGIVAGDISPPAAVSTRGERTHAAAASATPRVNPNRL